MNIKKYQNIEQKISLSVCVHEQLHIEWYEKIKIDR